MTIIFSAATFRLLTMTVDSAVTNTFSTHTEFERGRKAYWFDGIGCVATWGERVGNNIGRFLSSQNIEPGRHTVNDLADLVEQYLQDRYAPHQDNLIDVGYHVAGFEKSTDGLPNRPRLYHIFYGFDRPRPAGQTYPNYKRYDHSPGSFYDLTLLYNGRNDLAHIAVQAHLNEAQGQHDRYIRYVRSFEGTVSIAQAHAKQHPPSQRYNFGKPVDQVLFGDFVTRFAAEITREVGPPFQTFLISPQNRVSRLINNGVSQLAESEIRNALIELGLINDNDTDSGYSST